MPKNRVGLILRSQGVAPRRSASQRNPVFPVLDRYQDRVKQLYLAGMAQTAIAEELNIGLGTVSKALDRTGVERRPLYETHHRTYTIDHDVFAELTTEAAYWAGFVMADGCIYRGSVVQVSSQVGDAEHLAAFLSFADCSAPVHQSKGNIARASLHSPKIVADLGRHGIVPRKSYGARASRELAEWPAFWLGVIDGDGTVGCSRAPYISVCGSRPLMRQYQRFLARNVLDGRSQRIFHRNDGLCIVTVEGVSARRLAELLYSASPVSLKRKRKRAEGALKYTSLRSRTHGFALEPAKRRREKRETWGGNGTARNPHVASLDRSKVKSALKRHHFCDLRPWKPAARSSMVAFIARVDGDPALIWVTARCEACIPDAAIRRASGMRLFSLHISPRDPEISWSQEIVGKASSKVPLEFLAELRRESTIAPTR